MHRTLSAAGAFWLAAFTYFIWGFTFLASRIAQDYGTPFVLLFWRFALAFLLLNLLRLTGRFPVRFRSRKLWPVLLAGLFEPVLYFPCEQYGLKLTSTSFSGVMVALIPLCSLVYGAVFLHEKATWRQVVFSVLSVAGVIVLAVYATGIGAGICGIGGLYYVLDYNQGIWATTGQIEALGWLAVALVIFTTWKPLNAIWGAYLFGVLYWLYQFLPSLLGITVASYMTDLIQMLPYVVTIVVLIVVSLRKKKENQPPEHLGLSYFREER